MEPYLLTKNLLVTFIFKSIVVFTIAVQPCCSLSMDCIDKIGCPRETCQLSKVKNHDRAPAYQHFLLKKQMVMLVFSTRISYRTAKLCGQKIITIVPSPATFWIIVSFQFFLCISSNTFQSRLTDQQTKESINRPVPTV